MKNSLFFATSILVFLAFQNTYSEESRTIKGVDPSVRRFVLWRVYTQPLDSNAEMYVTVDSVLRTDSVYGNFHIKEKFRIPKRAEEVNKLKSNTYYLALTMAACNDDKKNFRLLIYDILPYTLENKEFLSKKWSEMKVIYDPNVNKYFRPVVER